MLHATTNEKNRQFHLLCKKRDIEKRKSNKTKRIKTSKTKNRQKKNLQTCRHVMHILQLQQKIHYFWSFWPDQKL